MNSLRMPSIVIAALFTQVVVAQDVVKLPDKIVEKTKCLNPEFLFYRPKGVDASKKAPLLVYLHGMAWRGRNIKLVKRVGGWGLFANAEKHKLLLVMPQCDMDVKGGVKGSGRWNADDVNLLLEYLKENHQIDENRIYLAGYSMGGFGTWACAISYPKTFAAIAPIAGGADPGRAETIKHLPIWVFHGQKDTRVPHKRAEDMVKALKSAGARNVKFTSYPDQGHNRALGLAINHPELYKWFLSHSRGKSATGVQVAAATEVTLGRGKLAKKATVHYLLSLPEGYNKQDKCPLMIFLHGMGERGTDLNRVKVHGPPKIVAKSNTTPFIIISPQCPRTEFWNIEKLSKLLDHILATTKADPQRVYLTGLSMGGYGTWAWAASQPQRFAAAIPICGGGNPRKAKKLVKLPIWAFHGRKDNVVALSKSKAMVDAIKKAGGTKVKLTVYPEAGHNSWTKTYNNPEIYKWLLSHRRAK